MWIFAVRVFPVWGFDVNAAKFGSDAVKVIASPSKSVALTGASAVVPPSSETSGISAMTGG